MSTSLQPRVHIDHRDDDLRQVTRFIVVRHGQTVWNRLGRIQGQQDSRLTALGMAEAERVAIRLAQERVGHLISSDLGRALATAEIIARESRLAVAVDARLRERHYGVFQGLTHAQARARHSVLYAEYEAGDLDHAIPGGESARECLERNLACLEDLVPRYAGQCIVVVAHGGVLEGVRRHVLKLPYAAGGAFAVPNACWLRLSCANGEWRIDDP